MFHIIIPDLFVGSSAIRGDNVYRYRIAMGRYNSATRKF